MDNGVAGTLRANYQTASRVHTFEVHGPSASAYISLGFAEQVCEATILTSASGSIYSRAASGYALPGIKKLDGIALAGGKEYYEYYGYKSENEDFVAALRDGVGIELDVVDYHEHALSQGADASAVAYVETQDGDGTIRWGVGTDSNIITASLKAVLGAADRAVRG